MASERDLGLDPDVTERFVDPSADAFRRLVAVMAKLRSPTGCPWDREQTHATLARHLLEETYEVLEAIDDGDPSSLREELGDLVLQVVFHSEIAFEEGTFTIADVLDELRAKLVRRHPHVFGDEQVSGADEVLANWEAAKRAEKGAGVMEGIPSAMPALARAAKVGRRAAGVGFELADGREDLADVLAALQTDEPDGDRLEEQFGDVLFAVARLGRRLGVEPESALRRAVVAFEHRFSAVEAMASADGRPLESLSQDEWRRYWERAKRPS